VTAEEAAKLNRVRAQVAAELPELVARHHDRQEAAEQLHSLLAQLKAAREAHGLRLAELTERTGMDGSALSNLETSQRPNPTLQTLTRYAEAVGKRIVIALADA
jgi:DNA-binding Xre family transcriptional regulator